MHPWEIVKKADTRAVALADRHYSRRNVGTKQFMPPGQTIVLWTEGAVFGWWRPHPDSGLKALNGREGWTCTIFRNESRHLSSYLILQAELALPEDCGKDGLMTYVWGAKIRSSNPGFCFKAAGYRGIGFSWDRKKTLLQKPFNMRGMKSEAF